MAVNAQRLGGALRAATLAGLVAVNVALFSSTSNDLAARTAAQDAPLPAPSPEIRLLGPTGGPPALFISGEGRLAAASASLLPWRSEVVGTRTDTITNRNGTAAGDILLALRERPSLRAFRHIVVQGGVENAGLDAGTIETAVLHLLDEVSAKTAPGTTITLVGPVPDSDQAAEQLASVNDGLRSAVRERGIRYVDPTERGWAADDDDLARSLATALEESTQPRR